MNRRMFLSSALTTAVAASAARKPVKIGFLGGSHSHAFSKAKVVKDSPSWELVGVWEEDPKIRKRYEKAGVKLVARDELLGESSVEVIAVESAVRYHADHARMALEAGKHVHVEKPPALDIESFRDLVILAERNGLLMQMGYMWRYHPGIKRMLEAARKGWLGDIYLVRAMINTRIDPSRRPEWARFRGGQMFELGAHLIDPIARLLGRPNRVTPFLKRSGIHNDQLADNTAAVLEYPNALAVITSATLQPNAHHHRSFEIQGTNGTAWLRPIEREMRLQMDLLEPAGPYPAEPYLVDLPPYQRYVDDLEELAAAVRGEKSLSVTLQEDLIVQETLLRASGMA